MFLHSFIPSEILFAFGSVTVYAYSFFLALGVLISYGSCLFFAQYKERSTDIVWTRHIDSMFLPVVVGAFIGARIFFIAYHWEYFFSTPLEMFAVWHGGLVFHGALVGGVITAWFMCKFRNISLLEITDLIVIALPFGQAIGRWGNYVNQEAYGLPTRLPWGIPIEPLNRVPGYEQYEFFHPTFLYESIWNVCLGFVLSIFFLRKKNTVPSGVFTSVYLIGYSVGRFFIEYIRIDPVPILLGLRIPQWTSLVVMGVASVFLGYFFFSKRSH